MGRRIIEKMLTMFTAALGVVAALAWDDFVKTLFEWYYPFPGTGLQAKLLYAVLVTIVAVMVTTILAKWLNDAEERERRK